MLQGVREGWTAGLWRSGLQPHAGLSGKIMGKLWENDEAWGGTGDSEAHVDLKIDNSKVDMFSRNP